MSVVGLTGRFFGGKMRRPLYFPEMILMIEIRYNVFDFVQ